MDIILPPNGLKEIIFRRRMTDFLFTTSISKNSEVDKRLNQPFLQKMADFLGLCWLAEIECMKSSRQSFELEWPTSYSKSSYLTLLIPKNG